ncbi:glycosyltransferase family 4 protein [Bergeyella sp. RCAD1439]|uniref:glycosyltransferase family 4 protein n=1 Tax=Bergeyella anatis TaxID=3113737 RepID=UPI002E183CFA|nr:MraY family glycosyltransferase [Bergeyella sp. RCAD1439]
MNFIDGIILKTGISLFYYKLVLGFGLSFFLTYYSIPLIIKISKRKNLMDEPGIRSSHHRKIPNLGGIAIFFSLGVCAPVYAYELFDAYKFLFASLIILFYVGVMDDIMVMRAYKKLLAQILVSLLIVIGSDVRIRSLFGVLGIYEMNYYFSVLFSVVTFVILINAFNLIDGIDGLAGTYSVLAGLFFGISYFRLGSYNYPLVILSALVIGSVLAFLYYNLSPIRSMKIFMGDTGSMILGFLLAFTAVCFMDIFIDKGPLGPHYHLRSAPVVAVAILVLPIVDTMNVIIIRLLKKQSPFEADQNHIHHKVLRLGLSHRGATFSIVAYYVGIVGIAYLCRHLNPNLLLALVLALGFAGAYLPDLILRMRNNK